MSNSKDIAKGSLVTFSIKSNGTAIPDTIGVFSIVVEKTVNSIAMSRITIIDGNPSEGNFKASSSTSFQPGNEISIEAGYDLKNKLIFKGIITKQSIEFDSEDSKLIVECKDAAYSMIIGRKSKTYSSKSDSDIITSIIGNYSKLTSNVSTTSIQWPQQVQYYATDWDYVMSRAEANGFFVNVVNGKVSVKSPLEDATSVLSVSYGRDLLEFNADLNAITQLGSVKASAWNFKEQEMAQGEASNNHEGSGDISSKKLSELVDLSETCLLTTAPLEDADLTNWAKAQMVKSEFSKIMGEATIQGTAAVEPGNYITLEGLGPHFDGDHFVSGVTHTIAEGNWLTEVSIGLSPVWFTERTDITAPPASGLLPGVQGIFNATVKKMYEDPEEQFRILIDIPLFDTVGEGLWARLSNFYSTSGAGAFFLPEVGDEVIVGFLNEDPRFPVILGSLYSSTKIKPFEGLEPNEKNTIKAIVTKSGINIQFDDENKILTLVTPEKNTIVLSDKDKKITIEDQNSNSMIMSDSGITIKSDKDIHIEASQNLTLSGNQGVTISSSEGDVSISGMNIKESAQVQYSAKGSASAEVQGGGELTLKGAMVMIN